MDYRKSDRDFLKEKVKKSITKVFDEGLTLLELNTDEDKFKKLRSRLLRVGNDQIRFMMSELNKYIVTYKPIKEERIVIKRDEGESD